MKALCFTFDRNMPVMEYVLHTYFKCWPDNPFVFYVPWNKTEPRHLIKKYGASKIKLVAAPDSGIKPTLRALLQHFGDEEFLWWAQDDKYILDFKVKSLIRDFLDFSDSSVGGFMFTKNADAERAYSQKKKRIKGCQFIEKKNYHQIFQPQILNVSIIKELYLKSTPKDHYPLAELYPSMRKKPIKPLYTTPCNYINIAESLDQGKLTQNLVNHMREDGFAVPNLPRCNKTMIYAD